jgi:hypothetical protein
MQVMHVGRRVLLSAIFSAVMTIGCTPTEESNGSGGGQPSPFGDDVEPQFSPYKSIPVKDMECPDLTAIITGTVNGAPYNLTMGGDFTMVLIDFGWVELAFSDTDFVYFTSQELFRPDTIIHVLGIMQLPNTDRRYYAMGDSRLVVNKDLHQVDFHLFLTSDSGADGELEGCANGLF